MLSLLEDFNNIKITDKSLVWNTEVVEALELKNLISQSIVSIESALVRKESRGAHSELIFRKEMIKAKHAVIWVDER